LENGTSVTNQNSCLHVRASKNSSVYPTFPPLPVLEGEKVIELDPDADYLTRRITERAVKFIGDHKDENFFLYVAHPLPHGPLAASAEIKKELTEKLKEDGNSKAKNGIYPAAIHEIDWSVGQILTALKENEIDENTLVLFTSDNGPSRGTAKPLTGRKTQTLEGGMRVPTVIRWPKGIPAGSDNNKLITAMDVLPTMTKLIGAKLPEDLVIDGKDMMPVLTEGADSQYEYFFYSYWDNLEAVRWGDWKLRIAKQKVRPPKKGKRQDTSKATETPKLTLTLHNLADDIAEKKNVAKENPEIVAQLKAEMEKWETEMTANTRPAGYVKDPKPLTLEK